MSTVAYIGKGCSLSVYSGASFVNVAQLQKFSFSGIKLQTDDVTNIDSPSGYKEIITVLIDPGDVSLEGILDPENASQTDLNTLSQTVGGSAVNFKITLSNTNATTITFAGFVTEYVPAVVETTKAITFSAKITISGAVTIGS